MRFGICGLGLIGSSAARALLVRHDVLGMDPDPVALDTAVGLGVRPATSWDDLRECDLVLLAAPTGVNEALLAELMAGGVDVRVADLGSVKQPIDRVWRRQPAFRFVGTHPMAGSERAGPAAGSADLFRRSAWPIVVSPDTDPGTLALTLAVITELGGRPTPMTAAGHDRAVALVSHLPHLLAGALGAVLAGSEKEETAVRLAAGSFRDLTRVGASPPERTAGFETANAELTAAAARSAAGELERVAELLDRRDLAGVTQWFAQGHQVRRSYEAALLSGRAVTHAVAGAAALRDLLAARVDTGLVITGVEPDGDDGVLVTVVTPEGTS